METKTLTGSLTTSVSSQAIDLGSGFGTPTLARIRIVHQTAEGLESSVDAESVGFHDGTNDCYSFHYNTITTGTMGCQRGVGADASFRIDNDAGTTLVAGTMSFSSDTVTLSFDTQASTAFLYELRVHVGADSEWLCGYSAGTDGTISTSFEPKVGEFHGSSTSSASTPNAAAVYGLTDFTTQACWRYGADDGTGAPDFFAYFNNDAVSQNIFGPSDVFEYLRVTGTSASGFTIDVSTGDEPVIFAVGTFDNAAKVVIGTTTAKDSTALASDPTESYTGVGFVGGFIELAGIGSTVVNAIHAAGNGTNPGAGATVFDGSFDGTTHCSNLHTMRDQTASPFAENAHSHFNTSSLIRSMGGEDNFSDTVVATLDSFDSDGFTLRMTSADYATTFVALVIEAAGDGTVTESATDTVTVTDTVETGILQTETDSVTLTDTATQSTVVSPSDTDTVTITDSVADTTGYSVSDTVTVTDSIESTSRVPESLTETVTLTDAADAGGVQESVADTVTITDQLEATVSETMTDTVTVTDTVSPAQEGVDFSPTWWGKMKEATIDTSFVSGPTKTNFPLLMKITDPAILQQTRGDKFDLVLTNEQDQILDYEVEYADANAVWVWVKVPALAGATPISLTDTVILTEDVGAVGGIQRELLVDTITLTDQTIENPAAEVITDTLALTDTILQAGTFQSSVTRNSITWTFDAEYEVGQYITGDWWVRGTPTVTSVSPGPAAGRNGSMLNPSSQTASGYDSRDAYYDSGLSVTYPVTLSAGDSLVSTVSQTAGTTFDLCGFRVSDSQYSLTSAEVLTCVASAPSATAFRPPLAGSAKPTFDSASIRWDLLPSLSLQSGAFAAPSAATATDYARYFERPWILHVRDWVGRRYHPTDNMPNYHREVYAVISDAACILISDLTQAQKNDLMIGFIQVGIDTYYATEDGAADSSCAKWPVLFAGIMLDNADMKATGYNFRTELMTYYRASATSTLTSSIVPSSQFWTGATVGWRQDPGQNEHEHLHYTEWGALTHISGGGFKREQYRRSNSYTWPGFALAAITMSAQASWNHAPFFDYVDRWMTEPDTQNKADAEAFWSPPPPATPVSLGPGGGSAYSDFVEAMWAAHR